MILETPYKDRIRMQAHNMFMQYGVRSVSMDDIAHELGASKKTLYQYYTDKDSLVMAVVEEELMLNCNNIEENKQKSQNAIHECFLAMDCVVELFRNMIPSLMYDLQKYHAKAYQKFFEYKSNLLYKEIKYNLEWGITDGLYRDDFDIEIMAHFRLESITIPFSPDFYTKINAGLATIHEELFYAFLYSLATPKGYRLINKYKKQKNKKLSNAKA